MHCRDVRGLADSYVDGGFTDESRELVQHLAGCPACRDDVDTRRALKAGVQRGFRAATELTPTSQYLAGLRTRLESEHASPRRSTWAAPRVWALAAALVVAAAASLVALHRGAILELARAAVGDHRNCALEFKLAEAPIPLEEAARRYGSPIACSRPSRQRRCRRRRARPALSPGIRACTRDDASHTWSSSIAACTCRCS